MVAFMGTEKVKDREKEEREKNFLEKKRNNGNMMKGERNIFKRGYI